MRRMILGIGLLSGACTSGLTMVRVPLPAALQEIVLVEGHPQIPPAVFPHAAHTDAERMGRVVECAECHHPLRQDPAAIPGKCTACHLFTYLVPEREVVDEGAPHDHELPPDL